MKNSKRKNTKNKTHKTHKTQKKYTRKQGGQLRSNILKQLLKGLVSKHHTQHTELGGPVIGHLFKNNKNLNPKIGFFNKNAFQNLTDEQIRKLVKEQMPLIKKQQEEQERNIDQGKKNPDTFFDKIKNKITYAIIEFAKNDASNPYKNRISWVLKQLKQINRPSILKFKKHNVYSELIANVIPLLEEKYLNPKSGYILSIIKLIDLIFDWKNKSVDEQKEWTPVLYKVLDPAIDKLSINIAAGKKSSVERLLVDNKFINTNNIFVKSIIREIDKKIKIFFQSCLPYNPTTTPNPSPYESILSCIMKHPELQSDTIENTIKEILMHALSDVTYFTFENWRGAIESSFKEFKENGPISFLKSVFESEQEPNQPIGPELVEKVNIFKKNIYDILTNSGTLVKEFIATRSSPTLPSVIQLDSNLMEDIHTEANYLNDRFLKTKVSLNQLSDMTAINKITELFNERVKTDPNPLTVQFVGDIFDLRLSTIIKEMFCVAPTNMNKNTFCHPDFIATLTVFQESPTSQLLFKMIDFLTTTKQDHDALIAKIMSHVIQ